MMISAVIGAVGSLVSGMAAMQQSQYQAAVAEANAKQARLNAELAGRIGFENVQDLGIEHAGRRGTLEARIGGSGLAASSPSFDQARSRVNQLNILEQRRTIEGAYREAANYKTQSNVFKAEAGAARSAGKFSMIGGVLGAAGSIAGAFEGGDSGFQPFATKSGGNSYYNNPGSYSTQAPAGTPSLLSQRFKYWTPYGIGFNTGY